MKGSVALIFGKVPESLGGLVTHIGVERSHDENVWQRWTHKKEQESSVELKVSKWNSTLILIKTQTAIRKLSFVKHNQSNISYDANKGNSKYNIVVDEGQNVFAIRIVFHAIGVHGIDRPINV